LEAVPPPRYTVAVRQLCEFTAKAGDLDLRFTPSPTAEEGIEGHNTVARRRGAGYRREVRVETVYRTLKVRGRIDGYDPEARHLEEVKTHRGPADRIPANHRALHWAQAQVYGALLCEQLQLAELRISVVYFDIDTGSETPDTRSFTAAELQALFEAQCERFLAWAEQEATHRERRNGALAAIAWPHTQFPEGQRQLATAVYNAARSGRCLLAQAPTGIGKTIGTLFPMLKAMPTQGLDKVFFLTAKTSGRQQALDTLAHLRAAGGALPLRVLELVAREKSCEHPDKACHGDSCPLARRFYDRLPDARHAAVSAGELDKATLRALALQHEVCPYYLGQELARWADVVVGDYNHYFDLSALLHGLAVSSGWAVGVLVDEAHNMLERARMMYTATLAHAQLQKARKLAPPLVKKPLDRLHRQWNALAREQADPYRIHAEVPAKLAKALKESVSALAEHLAEAGEGIASELLQFHFEALHFDRLLELLDEHSQFELSLEPGTLCVRNVVPAPHLKPRFAAARSTVLFSATLAPAGFHQDMLGLPDDTGIVDVPSAFDAGQLAVHIVRHVSTRWRDRARSVAPIVELIARRYREAPGNYLAFFSSFAYLREVAAALQQAHPQIPMWEQSPGMSEDDKSAFLARFQPGGRGVAFAVLGGSFGEGIDLPGTRLVGAFIATLGLPQVNPVNEAMKDRMDAVFGTGYDYAYLYPGLQKVVQAAGRVVRSATDRGVVYLIDDRYQRAEVRRLLPTWWRFEPSKDSIKP
jgi:Rad3-related DNA helicase